KLAIDAAATKLAGEWFDWYRAAIRGLSHERQDEYRQIKGMSDEPQDVDLPHPTSRLEMAEIREEDGSKTTISTFENHLLCGADGKYPAQLTTSWEAKVLKKEMGREDFVAWYRNPDHTSQDSLGIAYIDGKRYGIVRPDFMFFSKT